MYIQDLGFMLSFSAVISIVFLLFTDGESAPGIIKSAFNFESGPEQWLVAVSGFIIPAIGYLTHHSTFLS